MEKRKISDNSKKKKWIKISVTAVSALIAVGCLFLFVKSKKEKSILDSYANASKPKAVQVAKLKSGPAKVYPSDIDNVKMVTPFELSDYRSQALSDGYGDNYAGYVSIPAIGMYLPILNGVNMYTLSLGAAAYYPTTVPIGGAGNYVLAGHNMNTSLNVLFSRVPNLVPNVHQQIILTDKVKNYYYQITDKQLVRPYQPVYKGTETPTTKSILYSDKKQRKVTLFTCNYNGTRRWVITGQFDYETKH